MVIEETTPRPFERTTDGLVGRLFEASLGMFEVMAVYLGERLGLYRALHEGGPATPSDLATRAGIDGRYAREWLEQQAVSGMLDVDDEAAPSEERRYGLPDDFTAPLLDPDSAASMAPLVRAVVACSAALPQLVEAYRSGRGVEWADYGPDMIEGQGDFNRPWLRDSFASTILPAIPALHARLTAGGRVADVACGVGWAAIAIAVGYPGVTVDGFDLDPASIELARANAEMAGVADRVHFQVRDAGDAAAVGQYDVAVVIEAIHDLARPVEALSAIRRMLRPGGIALVADEKTQDRFTAPASEIERLYYGFSILTCLPAAMNDRPTAATGTVLRADGMRALASGAGFARVDALAEPSLEMLRFYTLEP
jgi:2-polyprenyl-3-methyl-5-hydroxy-6-metoxy-1,4-benzoquinol methylase